MQENHIISEDSILFLGLRFATKYALQCMTYINDSMYSNLVPFLANPNEETFFYKGTKHVTFKNIFKCRKNNMEILMIHIPIQTKYTHVQLICNSIIVL